MSLSFHGVGKTALNLGGGPQFDVENANFELAYSGLNYTFSYNTEQAT